MAVSPRAVVLDFAICIAFFTRLPLPGFDAGPRKFSDALWAAPLAGAVVGISAAAVYATANVAGAEPGPAAALALAAGIAVTGALHEDGLADTADGFGGGKTREHKLEIMRDSRIGSFGALALILSVLLRWSALASVAESWAVCCALVAAHGASRGMIPGFMQLLPPARAYGLAAGAGVVKRGTALAAALVGSALLMPLGASTALVAAVSLAGLLLAFRWLCLRQIGGHTGDTVGALQQVGEALVLIIASAAIS